MTLDAADSADVAWPTRKTDVSRPSRMTAVNASTASPTAEPSVMTLSSRAWSSPRIAIDWRRIQKSIQVTTVAATMSVPASKYCS
jgi:hypothetical protein